MEDQYGMPDLRQYISGRPFFHPISRPPDFLTAHRGLISSHPYDMLMFGSDSAAIAPNATTAVITSAAAGLSGYEMEAGGLIGGGDGGDGVAGRWPRQETLILLEIRSRLDPKFKEANQKGPLWDEVSRIMSEEHGYQRSGKKCREKFENLYKYYKKTKEGKAGRRHGKHYRFFRQLEALYGETSNSASVSETHSGFQYNYHNNNNISLANNQEAAFISLSNSSDFGTTASDESDMNVGTDTNDRKEKKRRGKRGLGAKIRDSIGAQMTKLMEKQEAWMEKMMSTIELKDQERVLREEQWRKQDAARIEREHKFWASERAWMEAREAALMDAFQKLTGKQLRVSPIRYLRENNENDIWPECEITRLIQLRSGMELKFQEGGISEEVLWDEIANKMACFGHDKTALMCKVKWDSVNDCLLKCNKKRRENTKGCTYNYQNHESICCNLVPSYCDTTGLGTEDTISLNDHRNSPVNSNAGNAAINDTCFRYFIGDAYGRTIN